MLEMMPPHCLETSAARTRETDDGSCSKISWRMSTGMLAKGSAAAAIASGVPGCDGEVGGVGDGQYPACMYLCRLSKISPAAELKCAGGGGGTGGPGAFSLLHSMVRCLRAGQKGSDV